MASSSVLLISLIILSISSSTLSSSVTLSHAAQILSNSGFLTMSLTLQLASKTINLESQSATVFAPANHAFRRSGQPSLHLLKYHIAPRRLPLETLKTLPSGTRIPTMEPDQSLVITASPSSDGFIAINNVRINEEAIFDDGSIVAYGIDEFFNSSFQTVLDQTQITPGRTGESFVSVADFLRPRGYSIIATFLDAQLVGFQDQTKLTIFAPVDEAIEEYVRNISDYSWIFRRHVVPRLLSWQDLIGFGGGNTMFPTFFEGFSIKVKVSNDVPVLNDHAPVVFQDIYHSDWLIVHGLNGLLNPTSASEESMDDSFSDGYDGVENSTS
ncbi:hypothetical protein UlMin_013820 [Ulmus minor]